jgi:hypothetical protein
MGGIGLGSSINPVVNFFQLGHSIVPPFDLMEKTVKLQN